MPAHFLRARWLDSALLFLLQPSRADGDDADTSATQLLLQGQRKCGQKGLGRGVGARKGNGLKARSRGDVDDALLPSLQHSRKEAVGKLNDGLVVEAKHFELPKNREGAEFSAQTKAGVVDEQVDRNIAIRELFRQGLAGSGDR